MRSVVLLWILGQLSVSTTASSPLRQVFQRLQETSVRGCDVSLLPDWIHWCHGIPSKDIRVPESTVCQSSKPDMPYLVCIQSRWRRKRHLPETELYEEDDSRQKRSISQAYEYHLSVPCTLFCDINSTGFIEKTPPTFVSCPDPVVLYPPGGAVNVTYNWTEPYAIDYLGDNVTSVTQVAGPDPGSQFPSAVSPGNHHVISYLAADRNNMNWPCTFTVVGEIPTCPPFVNLTDGKTTCTDTNHRGSTCGFTCNVGYTLTGSNVTLCQDDGTWSDEEPTCDIVQCDAGFDGVNITDADIVCENETYDVYDSVCWVVCRHGYLLRNDYLESELIQLLADAVTITTDTFNTASEESIEAWNNASAASQALAEAFDVVIDAISVVNHRNTTLYSYIDNLNTLNDTIQQLILAYNSALQDVAIANENNFANATALQAEADQIEEEINTTIAEYDTQQQALTNIINDLNAATNASLVAQQAYNAAADADDVATDIANAREAEKEAALAAQQEAISRFNEFIQYQGAGNKVVPSYLRCLEDGTWHVPGDPYCEDTILPELVCPASFTVYLNYGETTRSVTWSPPTASDNSGSLTIIRLLGPEPGSNLTEGQHHVSYQAQDVNGNEALQPCDIFINVEVYLCDELSTYITDVLMTVTCDSFQVGATCTLSCSDLAILSGTSSATCHLNSTITPPTPYWQIPDSYCQVETCPVPPSLDNGAWECTGEPGGEMTSSGNGTNSTTGFTCTVICDVGYVMPYNAESTYTCDIDGVWSPGTNFPIECIERGDVLYSEYTLRAQLNLNSENCASEDLNAVMESLETILLTDMTSYDVCLMGYGCSLGEMTSHCDDMKALNTVEFKILITCVDYAVQHQCDLSNDNMAGLMSAVLVSIETRSVLVGNESLVAVESNVATCGTGGVINGKYCDQCGRGAFLLQQSCVPCSPGSYGDHAGRSTCAMCPTMTSSPNHGAISEDECLALCLKGTNSSTGNEPCFPCPLGMYQDNAGSAECIQCPSNTWSTIVGASNPDTDCVAYDIYMDSDMVGEELTTVSGPFSVVLWIKLLLSSQQVTLGLYDDQLEVDAFNLQLSAPTAQLMFHGWDNEPTDIAIEDNVWIMIGVTWEPSNNNVTVYKDGEAAFTTTMLDLPETEVYDRLVLTATSGTMLSGLSVTENRVSSDVMSNMFSDCSVQLPAPVYIMDDLAGLRTPSFRFLPTSCIAANVSITADYCGLHACQNGGACVHNNTGSYTCNCTDQYGGPFCEEYLVHGGWSEWLNQSSCSRTCGSGVQERYRRCDNPPKSQYGDDCVGNNTEIVDCLLPNCTVCDAPPSTQGETCSLVDENCQPECPDGFILPRGQHGQTFHCGFSTGYTWVPLPRLPLCAASIRPISYTLHLTLTFVNKVPCSVTNDVESLIRERAKLVVCIVENSNCTVNLTINGCVNQRRKRDDGDSTLDAVFNVELTNQDAFDLPAYYQTNQMTTSIEEAISAVSVLERTEEDVVDDPSVLNTELNGQMYLFKPNNVVSMTTTDCGEAQTPVGGVCATCQAGTMYNDGNCVLCDLGTYQSEAGQTICHQCGRGKSTLYVGARDGSECVDVEFFPTDYTTLIIVLVACVLAIIIMSLLICLARRFYISAKDREKYDMEADRVSLYTDFPDIAYNVYFKRRQVLGFDEQGYPIVGKTKFRSGKTHKKGHSDESDTDDGGIPDSPLSTKEPFAYPAPDGQDAPFSYDPYTLWNIDDNFPSDREVKFDFPKIQTAVRYRVPGKNHLANAYPLEMFGYTDQIRGRTRKLLPLPLNIPVPKKLPQLLYRPPETDALQRRLSMDQTGHVYRDTDIGVHPKIPLLTALGGLEEEEQARRGGPLKISGPYSKKKGGSVNKRSLMHAITSSISPRTWNKNSARSTKSTKNTGRSVASTASSGILKSAATASPRLTKSAAVRSPRSVSEKPSNGSQRPVKSASVMSRKNETEEKVSPRDALMAILNEKRKTRQAFTDDNEGPHPKPSRYMMPKDMSKVSLPPPPPRSVLKDARSHMEPETEAFGRKMVTIKEEDIKEPRPVISVSVNYPVPPSGSQWSDPHFQRHQRPTSDAMSARDTIVAPYSARPKSSFDKFLPAETKDSYRPTTSSDRRSVTPAAHLASDRRTVTPGVSHTGPFDRRSITPAFHPRPVLHKDVKVQRTQNFLVFEPPTNLDFKDPPVAEHSSGMQKPPPFLNKFNKVAPRPSSRTSRTSRASSSTGTNKFSPRDVMKGMSIRGLDDDDEDDFMDTRQSSFFFTEVPEGSELTQRLSSRREARRKASKKPSPPPSYSDSKQHMVIEDSLSMTFGEEE